MILSFVQWLQLTDFFTYLRGSSYSYPVVLSLHMVVLSFFGGLILMTDLRILGIALKGYQPSEIVMRTRKSKLHGLIFMLCLGFLLFGCKAEEYYYNVFFRMKLSILFLLLLNWLIFHKSVYENPAELDQTTGKAKLAAGLSLFLWVSVACCGRGIGYIEPPLEKLHAAVHSALSLLS